VEIAGTPFRDAALTFGEFEVVTVEVDVVGFKIFVGVVYGFARGIFDSGLSKVELCGDLLCCVLWDFDAVGVGGGVPERFQLFFECCFLFFC
jgi:hypothetical protein